MFTIDGKYSSATVMTDNADASVISQIYEMLNSPAINNPVVIMPDTHAGKGSVIGFTMRLGDKVIPNTIGVDIGCGMLTASVGRQELNPMATDLAIRKIVPTGFNIHKHAPITLDELNVTTYGKRLKLHRELDVPFDGYETIFKRVGIDISYALRSIGTLGGGNHFIELGSNNEGRTLITIHTGSRNFGLRTCNYHQDQAASFDAFYPALERAAKIADLKAQHERGEISGYELGQRIVALKKRTRPEGVAKGLEYLEGAPLNQYLYDMYAAQEYAHINRTYILDSICAALRIPKELTIESVHNYIDPNDKIIRKGAIQAKLGQMVIIPISRTYGTIIGTGRGNILWNNSAPHGAGRVMSRTKAKELVTDTDAREHMEAAGVYSSFDPPDEDDLAYRTGAEIESLISPTVISLFTIKPFLSIK